MYVINSFFPGRISKSLCVEQETDRLPQMKGLILGKLTANYILNTDLDLLHSFAHWRKICAWAHLPNITNVKVCKARTDFRLITLHRKMYTSPFLFVICLSSVYYINTSWKLFQTLGKVFSIRIKLFFWLTWMNKKTLCNLKMLSPHVAMAAVRAHIVNSIEVFIADSHG